MADFDSRTLRLRAAGPEPGEAPDPGPGRIRVELLRLTRLYDRMWTRVVGRFDAAIELDADDRAQMHLDLGREFARRGHSDEAARELQMVHGALERRARLELGKLQLSTGRPDDAVQSLLDARELGFEGPELARHLAQAYLAVQDFDAARVEFERARRAFPTDARLAYQHGLVLDRLGRYRDAAQLFQVAAREDPHRIEYLQRWGLTLESAGKSRAARKVLRRALELENQAKKARRARRGDTWTRD